MASTSQFKNCEACNKSIHIELTKCPHCNATQKKAKNKKLLWAVASIIVFVLIFNSTSKVVTENNTLTQRINATRPADQMKTDFTWRKTGFDSILEIDIKITNNNPFDVKDIEITCNSFGKSGSKIDSNSREIFEIFPQNSNRTFSEFNMGFIHSQVDTVACNISKATKIP